MHPQPTVAAPSTSATAPRTYWPNRLVAAIVAGLAAGAVATVVEIALWGFFTGQPFQVLLRDARLAAGIVLGPDTMSSLEGIEGGSIAIATIVHFALSIAYALAMSWFVSPTRLAAAVVGAVFGMGLFALNLYGFTRLFPWFEAARDPVTLATHIVFGIAAALVLRRFRADAYDGPTSWPERTGT
jgi:hypothetical protein